MKRVQSILSSQKLQRWLPWIAGGVLALGVITFLQVLNRPKSVAAGPAKGPVKVYKEARTVPPSPQARKAVVTFINTAVARRNLAAGWRVSGPSIRQDLTLRQWLKGDIPVVPYDADRARAPVKLDWSYTKEAGFEVILFPRRGSTETKPQVFQVTVRKFGQGSKAQWLVDEWVPRANPAVPDDLR